VVTGLGVIGQISARLHQAGGAKVIALDISKHRVAIAKCAGIDARKVDSSLADACYDILPFGADIVVEATGVPSVLKEAIELAASTSWSEASCSDARVLIQASYPDDVCFNYSHANGKQVRFLLSRDTHLIDYLRVIELLRNKMLKMRDLISDIRSPADAQKTFDELKKPDTRLMTVVFDWQ
jgi:threonine dehydrogenase-like Zn-dependent dehydrogenase